MRLILLLCGLSMLGVAVAFGYLQANPKVPALAAMATDTTMQSGPATAFLEQALAAPDTGDAPAATAPAAAPLITLAPKGKAKGARFVKPPLTD
ncbi:MAG: hypothetical protein U0934_01100 [Pseudotabrizicola sp.]|uniref:hypothetical protein n=1 Tax=Pseudotabrizicola sp. TaxID=2939647 RepID=UPI002719DB44|nr:hypothetical protein [Pseudotabrizicola sp.]MDO8881844.1 hypothetical protein [Pseudotabrizicola sp.]MDP2083120.1 hypothetical protein [Pseudotabrizicola sp.]MDZ7572538.1 hypothetical protein [Pseudotabrizicola sp.]